MNYPDRRFPAPWSVKAHEEAYSVHDATGFPIVYFHFETRIIVGTSRDHLSKDQARRFAANFAKIPIYTGHYKP